MVSAADFNAFGYNPEGFLAHLAAHTYGPHWTPPYTIQQFVGQPKPPRYGPPAPYQFAYLPASFRARMPPLYYGKPCPPYLSAPKIFNRHQWDALRFSHHIKRLMLRNRMRRKALDDDDSEGDDGWATDLGDDIDVVGGQSENPVAKIVE